MRSPRKDETYAEWLASEGGPAACGEGLGVFVGTDIFATPPAWVFVPLATATAATVQEALDHARKGRTGWPQKET